MEFMNCNFERFVHYPRSELYYYYDLWKLECDTLFIGRTVHMIRHLPKC